MKNSNTLGEIKLMQKISELHHELYKSKELIITEHFNK